ncbi:hypothetical protein KSP39_PZI005378 [Platanthera zijinensis]|uniref:Lipoyl-binding domain-containing protein n=1 Tax=Platanthera zijinensis TaxID=2320716 RepID=A0AAP0GAM3_9ASPA
MQRLGLTRTLTSRGIVPSSALGYLGETSRRLVSQPNRGDRFQLCHLVTKTRVQAKRNGPRGVLLDTLDSTILPRTCTSQSSAGYPALEINGKNFNGYALLKKKRRPPLSPTITGYLPWNCDTAQFFMASRALWASKAASSLRISTFRRGFASGRSIPLVSFLPSNFLNVHLKYADSHEWVDVDGTSAKIGITDHAQDHLGDVVYVELPEVGATVSKGKNFGAVESVKATSDVYSPVSGEVIEVNTELSHSPGLFRICGLKRARFLLAMASASPPILIPLPPLPPDALASRSSCLHHCFSIVVRISTFFRLLHHDFLLHMTLPMPPAAPVAIFRIDAPVPPLLSSPDASASSLVAIFCIASTSSPDAPPLG